MPIESNADKLDKIALTVNSIEVKVSNMEDSVKEIRNDVKDLRNAIYGVGGDSGINGRVKMLEDWKDSRIWFERVIISALVSEGIGIAFLIIHILTTP